MDSFCTRARAEVTITSKFSSELTSLCRTRNRLPIVSTPGLILSKGSVSHEGKKSTFSKPMKTFRSSKSFSASAFVGATTINGFLSLKRAIVAETIA